MNKLYISVLSAMLCVQQTQSMEKQLITNPGNETFYDSSSNTYKKRFVECTTCDEYGDLNTKTIDILSLKLCDHELNEKEIEKLVQQGANVNYKVPHRLRNHPYQMTTVPAFFAGNKTEQGIKNMQKLIALGAHLHHTPQQTETPLFIATDLNNTPMMLLLLPYEKIETPTSKEKETRSMVINHSLRNQKFEVIKLLLQLKLITANEGLHRLIHFNIPNREIFNYLIDNGADNYKDNCNTMNLANKVFSIDSSIIFLELICARGVFDEKILTNMQTLKTHIDNTIQNLENNRPK